VDYTPHTCMKCISSNPGAGEHHGCPYKTFGEEGLRAALGGMKITAMQGWIPLFTSLCFCSCRLTVHTDDSQDVPRNQSDTQERTTLSVKTRFS
jgi:hypothetical protein